MIEQFGRPGLGATLISQAALFSNDSKTLLIYGNATKVCKYIHGSPSSWSESQNIHIEQIPQQWQHRDRGDQRVLQAGARAEVLLRGDRLQGARRVDHGIRQAHRGKRIVLREEMNLEDRSTV